MTPGQVAGVRRGSTSTMRSAIHVRRIARMVHTAGLYPFFAASRAVNTTMPTQSTSPISISCAPMFGTESLLRTTVAHLRGFAHRGIRP